MKIFILSFSIFLFSFSSYSQDAPAPEYLIKQDFPDSVKNLTLTSLDGKTIQFSELLNTHKGEKVVIDIWASWCRDCIGGLPKVNDLQKKTQGENVVYVFLSLDKEEAKWKSAIERFTINGEHFWITAGWKNPLSNYIVLDWIPRYIVLDENGKIILPKAITADDKKLTDVLLKRMGI